jgi:uncharacterized flavoprotein (TIGR03862 family)
MLKVAIIGGGPAALMLAAMLDEKKYLVDVYEKNTAVGRKFLVAGDGGFNLTHSEDIGTFVTRYTPEYFLEEALRAFTNKDLCEWLAGIGIDTYVGSSKRIFPLSGIKPIEVLNAFLEKLKTKRVQIHVRHEWVGWNENNELKFLTKEGAMSIKADVIVFALGGSSWKVTGSDGSWLDLFQQKGIEVKLFQSSNCVWQIQWPAELIAKHEGKWLKNISVYTEGGERKGELVITTSGIEGSAVYALSPLLRKQLNEKGIAEIKIDFKPTFSKEELVQKLSVKSGKSITEILIKELKLTDTQIALLKAYMSKEDFMNTGRLAQSIKKFTLPVTGAGPLDEAISTVGGIILTEVDENFQLKKIHQHYGKTVERLKGIMNYHFNFK